MLEMIEQDGGDVAKYVEKAKNKDDNFRLMGFGPVSYTHLDVYKRQPMYTGTFFLGFLIFLILGMVV